MNIVLCDDDGIFLESMQKEIDTYFKSKEYDLPEIDKYFNAEEMISQVQACDIAFLDVEMDGMSGIEAVKKLRMVNKDVLVFIITAHNIVYLDDALEEGVYRYMIKPIDKVQLRVNLDSAMRRIMGSGRYITVKAGDETIALRADEVVMVYTEKRKTHVRTETEVYVTKQTIKQWEEILPDHLFAKAFKGILINLKYVRKVRKDSVQFIIPIDDAYLSTRNYKTFQRKFLQYVSMIN